MLIRPQFYSGINLKLKGSNQQTKICEENVLSCNSSFTELTLPHKKKTSQGA